MKNKLKEKTAIKHRTRTGEEGFGKLAKLKLQPSFQVSKNGEVTIVILRVPAIKGEVAKLNQL